MQISLQKKLKLVISNVINKIYEVPCWRWSCFAVNYITTTCQRCTVQIISREIERNLLS